MIFIVLALQIETTMSHKRAPSNHFLSKLITLCAHSLAHVPTLCIASKLGAPLLHMVQQTLTMSSCCWRNLLIIREPTSHLVPSTLMRTLLEPSDMLLSIIADVSIKRLWFDATPYGLAHLASHNHTLAQLPSLSNTFGTSSPQISLRTNFMCPFSFLFLFGCFQIYIICATYLFILFIYLFVHLY